MVNLPCKTCKAECCGTVPISQPRLDKIKLYLSELPPEEYAELAGQERAPLDCAFIDKRTHSCAVYPVRPSLCKLYGTTERLLCPHADYSLVQLLPQRSARLMVDLDGEPVMLTHTFRYEP
jgi:Fe-S-cluster containining protein